MTVDQIFATAPQSSGSESLATATKGDDFSDLLNELSSGERSSRPDIKVFDGRDEKCILDRVAGDAGAVAGEVRKNPEVVPPPPSKLVQDKAGGEGRRQDQAAPGDPATIENEQPDAAAVDAEQVAENPLAVGERLENDCEVEMDLQGLFFVDALIAGEAKAVIAAHSAVNAENPKASVTREGSLASLGEESVQQMPKGAEKVMPTKAVAEDVEVISAASAARGSGLDAPAAEGLAASGDGRAASLVKKDDFIITSEKGAALKLEIGEPADLSSVRPVESDLGRDRQVHTGMQNGSADSGGADGREQLASPFARNAAGSVVVNKVFPPVSDEGELKTGENTDAARETEEELFGESFGSGSAVKDFSVDVTGEGASGGMAKVIQVRGVLDGGAKLEFVPEMDPVSKINEVTGGSFKMPAVKGIDVADRIVKMGDVAAYFDKFVSIAANKADGILSIGLEPENLGRMTMTCREEDGRMAVDLVVESGYARTYLVAHESELKQLAASSGFNISQFNVRADADGRKNQGGVWQEDGPRDSGKSGYDARKKETFVTVSQKKVLCVA
jgi:hypothetical protein